MVRVRASELLQLRDPVLRAHLLRSWKKYWAIRIRWERASFAVRRLLYNFLVGARQGTESLSLFAQVVRAVVRPAALALVLTQVLGLTERLLLHLFPRLVPLVEVYTPDRGLYSTFLSTTAQIAGVFLGLYFTTMSLVASTSYKDVPREVRAAVLAEKVGSIYLQAVALLCAVALMLLAALSIRVGWSAGLLNFVALIGLSVTAVFSFVVLGKRAFEFFDPATLTAHLTQDFFVAVRSATTRGLHHRDRSFQAGYQKQAARALDTLHATTRLCADGDQAGSASTLAACKAALLALRAYLALKSDIPLDSYWFRRTHKHQSWLTADSSALEMAVKTQTVIHPKEEPDRVWVETSVLDLTVFALRSLVEKGELVRVAEASEVANEALSALVAHFELDQASRYHAELSGLALLVAQAKAATEADERARWVGVRALMYGPVTMATVSAVSSERINADMIQRLAASVSEGQASVVPEVPVPTEVREMLSWLAQTLRFERAAEGRAVTPPWFVEYAIAGAFVQFLSGALMPAVRAVNETYVPGAKLLLEQGRAREAATVIQVGLEAVHRVRVHTETLNGRRTELLAFDRGVEEVKYPEIDVNAVAAAGSKCIRSLHRLLAQAAPKLAMEKTSAERPDEFGHAYTTLGDACIEAIVESDADLFDVLFPAFFLLSVVSRERISEELSRHDGRTRAVFMSDPLLDVLDVSGYASLRGRLGAPRFEEVVSTRWKALLEANGRGLANLVMLVVSHRHAHMAISPRSVVRTGWKRMVSHQLVAEGWMKSDFGYREVRQQPLDAAARDFLKQGSWANVGDHFVATELLPLKEFQDVDRPRGIQEILSSIQRESAKRGRK